MCKVSSGALSLTHHHNNNCLIEGVTQYVVTGKIYTLVSGCQAHTIQIVPAHALDLTMGAAHTGLAPGIIGIVSVSAF